MNKKYIVISKAILALAIITPVALLISYYFSAEQVDFRAEARLERQADKYNSKLDHVYKELQKIDCRKSKRMLKKNQDDMSAQSLCLNSCEDERICNANFITEFLDDHGNFVETASEGSFTPVE